MLRLGNIAYSNCYPIHADVCNPARRPPWLDVVAGTPVEVNWLMDRGELDIAPCSSVEFARHSAEYLAVAGLCIGSDGPIGSILLYSRRPVDELAKARVALPTSSATARVMLRILLELRHDVSPGFVDFDQTGPDPLDADTADAALFIGDTALKRRAREGERRIDLGAEWTAWTGLPFVYALWLVRYSALLSAQLPELCRRLLVARDRVETNLARLARDAAGQFGLDAAGLALYWRAVRYRYTARMEKGLQHFLQLAVRLGEIPKLPDLRYYRAPDAPSDIDAGNGA